MPLSPNIKHGGRVYRYEDGKRWTNCGKVADVRSISGLVSFKGKLYASTGTTGAWRDNPRHRGKYRFDGIDKWTDCGCPDLRVVHLGVHNGALYGLSYDAGGFFKYRSGKNWQRLGPVPDSTQAYSMAIYEGRLRVGTWPTGTVFTYDGPQKWTNSGRLGTEKEVMGMSVYNGKLYAGTLPLAGVYRYDDNSKWTPVGQLDKTPNVRYRRAWAMAVFQGKLFCGTLPSRTHPLARGRQVHDTRPRAASRLAPPRRRQDEGPPANLPRWQTRRREHTLQARSVQPEHQTALENRLWPARLL